MEKDNKDYIYQRNVKEIQQTNLFLWNSIKDKEKSEEQILVENSAEAEQIVFIEKNKDFWCVNSQYNARNAARVWAESCEVANYFSPIIVFGMGNGMCIEELQKKYPENIIIVYEPCYQLFETILRKIDLKEILSSEKLFIAVGKKGLELFTEYIYTIINYSNCYRTIWKSIPNYERLFQYEYLKIKKIFLNWMRQLILSRNTLIISQDVFAQNFFQNMSLCIAGYSMATLKKKLNEEVDVKKYPAIIVSAGPSLDKNIKELKCAKNKAFIIVVDTALKAVLRAGVKPDIAVTIDPNKELILFEDDRISDLPILVCLKSNSNVLKEHQGKKIFFGEEGSYIKDIFDRFHKELPPLETGGSVANNAFSFAIYLGFETIILMGQDLAYPNKKGHTSAAYDDDEKNTIDFTKKSYFEVEDINGETVWTEENMDAYRMWFESQIVRHSNLHVIDATEGGAKIHGTEILTLKEALKEWCLDLPEVNFEKKIDEIETVFSKDEVTMVKKQLMDIPQELDEIRIKIDECIKLYQKLENNNESADIIISSTKEIQEVVNWLNEKSEMKLVEMYNYEADYNMQNKVLDVEKDVDQEIKTIAQNGKEMMNAYLGAIDCLEKNLDILYKSILN